MTCHPSHFEGPPDLQHNTPEQIEKNWEEFRKADKVNPRAIRRQHRWKPAHEPDYPEPASGWTTLNLKVESPPSEPDQRGLLHGGPLSGVPCPVSQGCDQELRVVGRMTEWEQATQSGVETVNLTFLNEETKERMKQRAIVILKCPLHPSLPYQWFEDMLPKRG